MEYIVGPLLALILSGGYTKVSLKKKTEEINMYKARIEKVEKVVEALDKETLRKMLVTVQPVAKAVKELQEAVGIQ